MEFEFSPKVIELRARLLKFMAEHVYPNDARHDAELAANAAKHGALSVPGGRVELEIGPVGDAQARRLGGVGGPGGGRPTGPGWWGRGSTCAACCSRA